MYLDSTEAQAHEALVGGDPAEDLAALLEKVVVTYEKWTFKIAKSTVHVVLKKWIEKFYAVRFWRALVG